MIWFIDIASTTGTTINNALSFRCSLNFSKSLLHSDDLLLVLPARPVLLSQPLLKCTIPVLCTSQFLDHCTDPCWIVVLISNLLQSTTLLHLDFVHVL